MKQTLSFLAALGCVSSLLAAATPDDFAATRRIESSPISSPRLAEVRLDASLLAATRTGFPDLRLFDEHGTELPRTVEPLYATEPRTSRSTIAANPSELRELPGNRIEARFVLAEKQPSPDGLDIRTPLRDFIRTVRVSGSPDGQAWQPLVENAEIFDYSRYMDIRRTEIALPSNSFRHFSIEISDASEERAQPLVRLVQEGGRDASRAFDLLRTPFRIQGISFWRTSTTMAKASPVLQDWPHAGFEVTNNPGAQTTEILIQTRMAPLTRLTIETPARNFQRDATVMAPDWIRGQKSWRTIARRQLTRVDLPGYARDDRTIEFDETRAPELRLILRNQDNPPLDLAGIQARGPVYRLLWLADPGAAYQIAFGQDRVEAPSYDTHAIRTALEQGLAPERWTLADAGEIEIPGRRFSIAGFFSRPAVFGSLLALAALALLILLARALKASDRTGE